MLPLSVQPAPVSLLLLQIASAAKPRCLQPSLPHLAKHDVLAIQPGGGGDAQEELAAVGIGAGVGHAEHAGAQVAELEVLICSMTNTGGGLVVTESPITQGFPSRTGWCRHCDCEL